MSWIARKVAGLDNEDQQQVVAEYFKHKQLLTEQTETQEIKRQVAEIQKFWETYGDEYYTGEGRQDG